MSVGEQIKTTKECKQSWPSPRQGQPTQSAPNATQSATPFGLLWGNGGKWEVSDNIGRTPPTGARRGPGSTQEQAWWTFVFYSCKSQPLRLRRVSYSTMLNITCIHRNHKYMLGDSGTTRYLLFTIWNQTSSLCRSLVSKMSDGPASFLRLCIAEIQILKMDTPAVILVGKHLFQV